MALEGYTCEECGAWVNPGDWPFCKGGHARPNFYATKFEEYWSKHLDPKKLVRISSWSQLDREMKARGLAHLSDFPVTEDERKHVEWSREERARRRERHG